MGPEDTFSICDTFCEEQSKVKGEIVKRNGEEGSSSIKISSGNGCCFKTYSAVSPLRQSPHVFTNDSCYICNGYYGPCFEDPVCSLCHVFLFPNMAPCTERPSSSYDHSSDSDSGNDEPVDCNSQDNMPSIFEELARDMAPIRIDTLEKELQRLSVMGHSISEINLDKFPSEVLMHMFKYLDELSLWSIGQVCQRWREILFMFVKNERWSNLTRLRWPLLPVIDKEQDWYELYTAMMKSACCLKCVKQMAAQNVPPQWEETTWRRNRLKSEIKAMRNDPLDGIEAMPLDINCCHWQATIEGPAGSPYEGGLFFLYIQVPLTYPLDPPIVRFITKIFHPNVSRHGDIGIDSIYHNWSLALTINKLLISIQSLLTDPFCDVCMEPQIGDLYMKNRKAFEEQARLWTVLYAMHDLIPH